MIEKLKYWIWKNWYLSHFEFNSVPRSFAEIRIATVYNLVFKEGGLPSVKKVHKIHVESSREKLKRMEGE
jgi:hypothetical protein